MHICEDPSVKEFHDVERSAYDIVILAKDNRFRYWHSLLERSAWSDVMLVQGMQYLVLSLDLMCCLGKEFPSWFLP